MKKPKKRLAVAVIVDLMGSSMASSDEEIAAHKKKFSTILSDYDLKFSTPKYVAPDMGADLVIYDFGGMMPGTSLMEDNSRAIIKWAGDHPSSLVVIASTWTFNAYIMPEIRALNLDGMKNVVMDDYEFDADKFVPAWFLKAGA